MAPWQHGLSEAPLMTQNAQHSANMAPTWGPKGAKLGLSWAYLASGSGTSSQLGPSWSNMEPSWGLIGPTLKNLLPKNFHAWRDSRVRHGGGFAEFGQDLAGSNTAVPLQGRRIQSLHAFHQARVLETTCPERPNAPRGPRCHSRGPLTLFASPGLFFALSGDFCESRVGIW